MSRPSFLRGTLAGAALMVMPVVAQAQLGSFNPDPGPRGTYAITNAHIVPVTGAEIAKGTIVINAEGKIAAFGASVAVPAGANVIDGSGMTVYPGMMDAGTSIGLSEIPQGASSTVDISETGSFNPNAQAFFGINPHSAHVGVTRVVGITHVLSRPTGGIVSGQAAIMNLAGSTAPQMLVVQKAALVIELPRSGFGGRGGGFAAATGGANTQDVNRTRQRQLDSLKTLFADADAYAKAVEAYAKDKSLPRPKSDVVLDAMIPVIKGQEPVLFVADRASDIRDAVATAKELKVKPIIVGGRDAAQVAAFLKTEDVPVLYASTLELPTREDDPYDVYYGTPGVLAKAGVRFAITSGEQGAEARNLPYNAGMAAAFGLSKDDALRSVTLWPAQILGVANQFGSIEVGKVANLVVTDGDVLEAKVSTHFLMIDGRPVPLDTKHTVLFEQFKNRK